MTGQATLEIQPIHLKQDKIHIYIFKLTYAAMKQEFVDEGRGY
jgi:hypothetical protein